MRKRKNQPGYVRKKNINGNDYWAKEPEYSTINNNQLAPQQDFIQEEKLEDIGELEIIKGRHNYYDCWIKIDNKPVGWIDYHYDPDSDYPLQLSTIQIREEYQGKGYSKQLIDMIRNHYDEEMYCSGGFTPQGFKALNNYLPILPGSIDYGEPIYKDDNYIHDWNKKITKY